ncbi:SDR family NAD(P)-dependent oxidoreductase [Arsenophonus nasoniae]|uniref:SDR family NAD(P)-dependent oxidoreductase n=1 Tax=Arsenophonus nasoniae TaxID=638 RepID=A0AA95GXU9_9GAMM|nr:SDR family NAD(P)-dependent oxidoreductase [Arsenophonus nasoniae]WGM03055.1 SDR family NAD(P)-dependent oxidoreductase [Arsenophonus nasoniae]
MIIFVTGVTAGFGEAITKKFIANGHIVIGTGRREMRLKKLHQQLGKNFPPILLDIMDKQAINNAVNNLNFEKIDVLVNNAGLALGKAFVKQFSLNLRADLQGKKIRVTDIEPGLVSGTEFSYVRFKGDAEKVSETYKGTNALTAEDIAEAVLWVSTLPEHVNINILEMMPVCQSFAGLSIDKEFYNDN